MPELDQALYSRILDRLRPPTPVQAWDWNLAHGRLSDRDSASPGPWTGERTPYWRYWHDVATARRLGRGWDGAPDEFAHLTEQIWIIKGTQMGGTRSFLLALLAWFVDQSPGPIGYFLPRESDFSDAQQDRLLPFFDGTPVLAAHLPQGAEARRLHLTQNTWRLDTCALHYLSGSNYADLVSRPLSLEVWDEFDLMPMNCAKKGDPLSLGLERMKTFLRVCLAIGTTTPTWVNAHGWRRLRSGSHQRLLVRCPGCQHDQELHPDRIMIVRPDVPMRTIADAVKEGLDHEVVRLRNWARWRCDACDRLVDDRERDQLVTEASAARRWVPGIWSLDEKHPLGAWVPRAEFDRGRLVHVPPPETSIRTGHINSLYSPFISIAKFASHEMAASYGSEEERINHRNSWRAEPTLPTAAAAPVSIERITIRASQPAGTAPAWVQRIAITCDQQDNTHAAAWFPYVVRGWGPRRRSILIAEGIAKDWDELARLEMRSWLVAGEPRIADAISLDAANGNMRGHLMAWARNDAARRLLLSGRDNLLELVKQRSNNQATRGRQRIASNVRWWNYAVDTWKSTLRDIMEASTGDVQRPGMPGWELHHDPDPEYMASLDSEVPVVKPDRSGRIRTRWEPRMIINRAGTEEERTDTHWWDCEVHQLVVAHVLKWEDLPEPSPDATPDPEPASARDDWVGAGASSGSGDWVSAGGSW